MISGLQINRILKLLSNENHINLKIQIAWCVLFFFCSFLTLYKTSYNNNGMNVKERQMATKMIIKLKEISIFFLFWEQLGHEVNVK